MRRFSLLLIAVVIALSCHEQVFARGGVADEMKELHKEYGRILATEVREHETRLAVDLLDGTRVISSPGGKSVRIETPYVNMNLALDQIRRIVLNKKQKSAFVELKNGNKVTWSANLGRLRLPTLVGEVCIPVRLIKKIDIRQITHQQGRAGPPAKYKKDLVLYYSFDKNDGLQVRDQSVRGNHGEVHLAKWTDKGHIGGAYKFDGKSHIALLNKRFLDGYDDTTICVWFNSHMAPGQGGQIFASGDPRGGNDPISTHLNIGSFGNLGLSDLARRKDLNSQGRSNLGVSPKSWHMLAITLKSGPDHSSYRVYLDGKVVDSQKYSGRFAISYDKEMPTQIGAIHGTQGWVGLIDELMVFNLALSQSEIKQLYLDQKGVEADPWAPGRTLAQ